LANRYKALALIRLGFNGTSELSLGLRAVAVTADGFNIMHASIADGRFFSEFAFILIIPAPAGTATRHQASHAVICALQPDFAIVFTEQATVFLIRFVSIHLIIHPAGANSCEQVPYFALAMNPPLKNSKCRYLFLDAGTKRFKRIFAAVLTLCQLGLFDLNQLTIEIPNPLTSRQLGFWCRGL
jgi:hypothetical protein